MTLARIFLVIVTGVSLLHAQEEFSRDRATADLRHLAVDIGPRPMGSPAEQEALHYAVEAFRQAGCDTAYVLPMNFTSRVNTSSGIAVGIKFGARGRSIVLGGHIDSANPEIPGADDDASGTAVVLECCRVLCARHPTSTLVFCAFGGEEQGLEGSRYFVNHFPELDSVALMLQADMANGLGVIEIDPDMGGGTSAPRWLVRAAAEEYRDLGYKDLGYPTHFFSVNYARGSGAGSDHESFLEKGIPAIDFSTDVSRPIHSARDNFENMDPAGMKRTGDLLIRLVQRFDTASPPGELDRYWLLMLWSYPFFVPIPAVEIFAVLSFLLAFVVLGILYRRRTKIEPSAAVRWSGLKLWLCTLLVTACAFIAPEVVSLIKGARFPWTTSPGHYFVLMCVAALLGTALAVRMAKRLRIAHDPVWMFLRGFILLSLMLGLFLLASPKLLVEPATALFLFSLAFLVPSPAMKLIAAVLAPIWLLRIVFPEWSPLIFRSIAAMLPDRTGVIPAVMAFFTLFLSIYLLPVVYAWAALARQDNTVRTFLGAISSRAGLVSIAVVTGAAIIVLSIEPMFNELWYQPVTVTSRFDQTAHTMNTTITSREYLKNIHFRSASLDTIIDGHTTSADVSAGLLPDTTWVTISRSESTTVHNDTTVYDAVLHLQTAIRPYTVKITYTLGAAGESFSTPWRFRTTGIGEKSIEWYSFPDTTLNIPVHFAVGPADTVRESIDVTFAQLAAPVTVGGDRISVFPRTEYHAVRVYHSAGTMARTREHPGGVNPGGQAAGG